MKINIRTLLPLFLFYFLKESSAQTVHNVPTYTSRLMEELECIFTSTGTVLWTEQRDDGSAINIFVLDVANGLVQKQTDDSKHDNFNYSIEGTDKFNLVIKNVEQDDAGQYQCNPITTSTVTFVVTVEVLPESINIDCTESNVCMPSAGKKTASEMITCNCTAYGLSSSQLEIQWDAVGINSISNTRFGSSSISSNITLQPPSETFSVSCSLTGYKSQIPESLIRDSITFSPPVCILTSVCPSNGTNASLTCSCSKGSHVVYEYSFYNSQKLLIKTQSNSTLQVNSDKVETFYCKGCNGVFHSQSAPLELNCNGGSAFPWWILIIICILLLFAAIFLFKKGRKKPAIHQDEENVEGGPEKAEGKILLGKKGDKQNHQEVQGSRYPTVSSSLKIYLKRLYPTSRPDDKSTSAGSSDGGEGQGKLTEHQNNSTNEEKAKKKRGENNQSADNNKRTNGGERQAAPKSTAGTQGDVNTDQNARGGKGNRDRQAAPESTAGTQGDVNTDYNARGGKGNRDRQAAPESTAGTQGDVNTDRNARGGKGNRDSSSQTNQGEESSVDLRSVTTNDSEASDQTSPNQTVSKQKKGEIRCQIRM